MVCAVLPERSAWLEIGAPIRIAAGRRWRSPARKPAPPATGENPGASERRGREPSCHSGLPAKTDGKRSRSMRMIFPVAVSLSWPGAAAPFSGWTRRSLPVAPFPSGP